MNRWISEFTSFVLDARDPCRASHNYIMERICALRINRSVKQNRTRRLDELLSNGGWDQVRKPSRTCNGLFAQWSVSIGVNHYGCTSCWCGTHLHFRNGSRHQATHATKPVVLTGCLRDTPACQHAGVLCNCMGQWSHAKGLAMKHLCVRDPKQETQC